MAGIGGVVPYPRGDGLTAATPRRLVSVRPEEADQLGVHDLRYLFVGGCGRRRGSGRLAPVRWRLGRRRLSLERGGGDP